MIAVNASWLKSSPLTRKIDAICSYTIDIDTLKKCVLISMVLIKTADCNRIFSSDLFFTSACVLPSPHAPFGRSPLYFLPLMIAHELLYSQTHFVRFDYSFSIRSFSHENRRRQIQRKNEQSFLEKISTKHFHPKWGPTVVQINVR